MSAEESVIFATKTSSFKLSTLVIWAGATPTAECVALLLARKAELRPARFGILAIKPPSDRLTLRDAQRLRERAKCALDKSRYGPRERVLYRSAEFAETYAAQLNEWDPVAIFEYAAHTLYSAAKRFDSEHKQACFDDGWVLGPPPRRENVTKRLFKEAIEFAGTIPQQSRKPIAMELVEVWQRVSELQSALNRAKWGQELFKIKRHAGLMSALEPLRKFSTELKSIIGERSPLPPKGKTRSLDDVGLGDTAMRDAELRKSAPAEAKAHLVGHHSAEWLLLHHGIKGPRLSEKRELIRRIDAPTDFTDVEGKRPRELWNVDDALKFCAPKRTTSKPRKRDVNPIRK